MKEGISIYIVEFWKLRIMSIVWLESSALAAVLAYRVVDLILVKHTYLIYEVAQLLSECFEQILCAYFACILIEEVQ